MGYIYLYTGTGGGKTVNGLGLALRTVGHGGKAVVIQFCKWRKDTGEYLIKQKLGDLYEIYVFGREAWLGKEAKTAEFGGVKFKVEAVTDKDREMGRQGLALAEKILKEKKPDLLVLDEINLAAHWNVVDVKAVLKLLSKVPEQTTVVMTGRNAPQEFLDRADFVNIVQDVKMPERFDLRKGIQY
ncbi:MAG: cob(I)yrinic acid a,c-diamide adenosyltransferase [Candidatus Bathyarchaeia archaeon]